MLYRILKSKPVLLNMLKVGGLTGVIAGKVWLSISWSTTYLIPAKNSMDQASDGQVPHPLQKDIQYKGRVIHLHIWTKKDSPRCFQPALQTFLTVVAKKQFQPFSFPYQKN